MNFTARVRNGYITTINGKEYFSHIAEDMALEVLKGNTYPGWREDAIKALNLSLPKNEKGDANTMRMFFKQDIPATNHYVSSVLVYFAETFVAFKENFKPPQVVANGLYTLENTKLFYVLAPVAE